MLRKEISTNAPLLMVTTCFCSSSLNAFTFKSEMKTITLYDLAALFGLHLYCKEINPTFIIYTIWFDFVIIKSTDYGPFIKSYCNRKDEVTQVEHIAFLLIWISKFLSCNCRKKVSKIYLNMVITLVTGAKITFGSFVLSHICKGMNDLIPSKNDKLNRNARGPI